MFSLEAMVEKFQGDIAPYAAEMVKQLAAAFARYSAVGDDDNEDGDDDDMGTCIISSFSLCAVLGSVGCTLCVLLTQVLTCTQQLVTGRALRALCCTTDPSGAASVINPGTSAYVVCGGRTQSTHKTLIACQAPATRTPSRLPNHVPAHVCLRHASCAQPASRRTAACAPSTRCWRAWLRWAPRCSRTWRSSSSPSCRSSSARTARCETVNGPEPGAVTVCVPLCSPLLSILLA